MDGHKIKATKPIGYIEHKPTHTNISVYETIGWFKRMMLRLCFGLEYHKINKIK